MTIKGLFWGGFSSGARQVISALLGLVLLNQLTPGDYGLVGMLAIFTGIAGTLQEGGFSSALINRKEFKHEDFNAVFWFNILMGLAMYIILWFCAPMIARFYGHPELLKISRVLFLSFVFSSFGISNSAYLSRFLMIRVKARIDLLNISISGIVAVILAIKGYGYWALVVNTVLYSFVHAVLLIIFTPWHPSFKINFKPIWNMFGFSFKLVIASFVGQIQSNIFSVVLGRYYSKQEVGYYSQGTKWSNMIQGVISGTVNSVAHPVFARTISEKGRQLLMFRKFLRLSACMVCPAMLGLAFIAPQLITLINDEFLPSVPVIQFYAIYCISAAVTNIYAQLNIAHGGSGRNLIITLINAALQITVAFSVYKYGINTMALAVSLCNCLIVFLWHYVAGPLVGMKLRMLLMDVLPYGAISALVMVLTYFLTKPISNIALLMVAKIIIAVLLYFAALRIFDSTIYKEFKKFIVDNFKK